MNSSMRRRQPPRMLSLVMCVLGSIALSQGGFIRSPLGIPHPAIFNQDILRAQLVARPIKYAIQDGLRKEPRDILQAQVVPRPIKYAFQDGPRKEPSVSYSITYEDYQYLKRHKVEGQDSPFNPEPTEPAPAIVDQGYKHKRSPAKHDAPCPDAAVLKRSVGTDSISGYNNILVNTPVEPVVHKHVYFHVPPPDFEEPPAVPRIVEPRKKNLNIVFIKVPSYEPSAAYLQQLLRAQTPIEDKTLIYVLSNKDSPEPPVVLPPKPSAPEVYFVKYKTPNAIEATNNELSLPSLLQNVSPVLERKREARDP